MTTQSPQPFNWGTPQENWCKMPFSLITAMPLMETEAEIKIVLYILRHTWGYRDYEASKLITLDEFQHGRKRKDGTRIDGGTGMARNSIKDGIRRAVEHGLIAVIEDNHDLARIKRYYKLSGTNEQDDSGETYKGAPEGQKLTPRGSEVDPQPSEVDPRTEKDTDRKNTKKEGGESPVTRSGNPSPQPTPPPAPAPLAQALIERAQAAADAESFEVAAQGHTKGGRAKVPLPDSPHYDGREFKNGRIPAGQGKNAVQVYYERHSIRDAKTQLTAPLETDIHTVVSDLDRWRAVVTAWHQAGHNPLNIGGMLDWYRDPSRLPSNRHTNGHSKPAVNPDIKLKDWLLRFYNGNHLPTVITLTGKSEQELRDEYRQWRKANGLPPG